MQANNHIRLSGAFKWVQAFLISLALCLTLSRAALAQSDLPDSAGTQGHDLAPTEGFYLKRAPGWSIGMETYAGLAVLWGADATRGHGLVGGLSRLRLGYAEMGAGVEVSDLELDRWQQVGGFVGAYLPIVNWVDIDATLGLAERNYLSPDTRYGPGGFDVRGSALTFRLGFSDRPMSGLFGLRVGAAMLVGVDLKHHEVQWSYNLSRQEVASGSTTVGGLTTGIIICFGFDVAFRRPTQH